MNNNKYEVEFNGWTIDAECIGVLEDSLGQEIYEYLQDIALVESHGERDIDEWAEHLFYVAMEDLLITCGQCGKVNDHTPNNYTICNCGHELYASPVISKKGE